VVFLDGYQIWQFSMHIYRFKCHDSGLFKAVGNCLIRVSLDLGEYFSLSECPGSGFLVMFINC
jgi:hypothetical protein